MEVSGQPGKIADACFKDVTKAHNGRSIQLSHPTIEDIYNIDSLIGTSLTTTEYLDRAVRCVVSMFPPISCM